MAIPSLVLRTNDKSKRSSHLMLASWRRIALETPKKGAHQQTRRKKDMSQTCAVYDEPNLCSLRRSVRMSNQVHVVTYKIS